MWTSETYNFLVPLYFMACEKKKYNCPLIYYASNNLYVDTGDSSKISTFVPLNCIETIRFSNVIMVEFLNLDENSFPAHNRDRFLFVFILCCHCAVKFLDIPPLLPPPPPSGWAKRRWDENTKSCSAGNLIILDIWSWRGIYNQIYRLIDDCYI